MGNITSASKISVQDRYDYDLIGAPKADDFGRAILDLKTQRDKLQQYQRRIAKLTELETSVARECLRRDQKSKALLALRRKKYQESLLSKTDAQLEQLQKLTSDIEFATVQKDVMFGLQQGTAVLKQIHAEMGGIENIEKLLGENEEARAYESEISDLLGGQLSNADEDEVEGELEALETEVNGIPVKESDLPDAPASDVALDIMQDSSEQKLARLEAAARSNRPAEAIPG